MTDYYEILEVHPKASQEIIKKAYFTLAKNIILMYIQTRNLPLKKWQF